MSLATTDPTTRPQPPATDVDRRPGLPYRDFVRDYLFPNRPVVVPDAAVRWRALTTWTPAYFKQQFGDRVVEVEKPYRVSELVDRIDASDEANPAPYLHAQHLKHTFPELLPDIEPLPEYLAPNWLDDYYVPGNVRRTLNDHSSAEIFLGGKSAGFPFLHYDDYHYHAFSVQVFGRKRFYMYPPGQTPLVYPFPDKPNFSQVRDVERPDLDRFPRFADARPVAFVLEPGELLFIPSGWWHTTKMLGPSISVSISHMNASNWAAFRDDYLAMMRPHHPRAIWAYGLLLRAHGLWKTWYARVAQGLKG